MLGPHSPWEQRSTLDTEVLPTQPGDSAEQLVEGETPWPPEHDGCSWRWGEAPSTKTGCWGVLSRLSWGQGGQSLEGTGKGPSSSVKGRSSVSASPGTPRTLSRGRCSGDGERGWGTPALLADEAKGTAGRLHPHHGALPGMCCLFLPPGSSAGPSAWTPFVPGPPSTLRVLL